MSPEMSQANPFRPDVPDVLVKICQDKRAEVERRRAATPLAQLEKQAADAKPRGFKAALQAAFDADQLALIAEIKKASPSAGMIRPDFDPVSLAKTYSDAGATCFSVLTDTPYFQGEDRFMVNARAAGGLPTLRKDFMVDPYQIVESAAMGADCVLIILGALNDQAAAQMTDLALELGMDVLAEVHDEDEMRRANALDTRVMLGVNNRDLRKMVTDLATFERLAPMANPGQLLVAESGLKTHDDMLRMKAAGAGAYLVGESLMRQDDVGAATRSLLGMA